jgi:hypothetical protein
MIPMPAARYASAGISKRYPPARPLRRYSVVTLPSGWSFVKSA